MSDVQPEDHLSKLNARLDEALTQHKHLTAEQLQALKLEIKEELANTRRHDEEDRRELRTMLGDLTEFMKEQKKAAEEADKIKGSKSTIVVPPSDVTPQQAPPPPGQAAPESELKKRHWLHPSRWA